MKAMSPSQTKIFVENALMMREIPYISGPPGIGKSDLVFQIGEEFGLKVLDVRLSQMLPEDLTGLPSLDEDKGKAHYNPFDTFPMEGDKIPNGYNGWLIFLDELSSATEEVMAAIYSLLLGHRVGGKKVHEKALIVAAGNRSTDSAIARPLPDTLITRMLPCEMKVSSKDWVKWAKSPNVKSHDAVVSFIEKYPDMLLGTTDPNKRDELEPYHTPRGWGKVFKIIHLHEKISKKSKITKKDASGIPIPVSQGVTITPAIQALLFSAVGTIAGQSFKEHYDETMQLPYPWEVAQSPSSTKIPSTTAGKAELTSNLADFFIETAEQSRDSILQFMNRMDGEHSALFAQILVEKLGNTASDQRLVEEVRKRLNVQDINVGGDIEDVPDEDATFFLSGQHKPRQVVKGNPFRNKATSHQLF
jgi:MoxR-like ATPase